MGAEPLGSQGADFLGSQGAFLWFVIIRFAGSLLLTLVTELGVARILGLRSRRELAVVAWVNVLTNPPLVWLLIVLSSRLVFNDHAALLFWAVALVLEAIVVALEWLVLRWAARLPGQRALGVSVVMNAASLVVGIVGWGVLYAVILAIVNAAWTPGG